MRALCNMLQDVLDQDDLALRFFLQTPDGQLTPRTCELTTRDTTVRLCHTYGDFEETVSFSRSGTHVVCRRAITNTARQTRGLTEAGLSIGQIRFHATPADDYFYHVENPRIYSRMAIPVDTVRSAELVADSEFDVAAGNKWVDAHDACDRIGFSPYQPFPAILLSNHNVPTGLVHGSLSQRIFYHCYLVHHELNRLRLDVLSGFKAIAYRELAPGETLEDSWYLGLTRNAGELTGLFSDYLAVLRQHLPPLRGAGNVNRHAVVWGSWNDGVFRDIDEARLLEQAAFLRARLPTVEWMQIDDGYSAGAQKLNRGHGIGAPYEKDGGTDLARFPGNLARFTRKLKETGLRPALWIGGDVPSDTPLARKKKHWFFDYSVRTGTPPSESRMQYLDVSKPEVREYMTKALDFLLTESGFEGMKHDFWSYAFEDGRVRLAGNERSGYEWRTWWLDEIRRRLPEDGYLQTGCDIVMGNPFLAEHFNNYRYGIDIGAGHWENVKINFLWGAACVALRIGDLFVPNSDSIGLLPGLTDEEALFCINYCLISRSMVEVAGWLYQQPDHPRMRWVRKALCCPNNGQDVHFAGYHYRKNDEAPAIWYVRTPHFSRIAGNDTLPLRTVGVFNLHDAARRFAVEPSELGLPDASYTVTDVWTLESVAVSGTLTLELAGRSSKLLAVNPTRAPQVLDANIRVEHAERGASDLKIAFADRGDLELVLDFEPDNVRFAGAPMKHTVRAATDNWIVNAALPHAGTVRVSWHR